VIVALDRRDKMKRWELLMEHQRRGLAIGALPSRRWSGIAAMQGEGKVRVQQVRSVTPGTGRRAGDWD